MMAHEPSAVRSPTFPVDTESTIRLGLWILLLGFGGFLAWSSLVHISSGAIAPGMVAVASQKKSIQHLEGGIVKQINTKEGARVRAGDVLVVLDDTQFRAQVDLLKGQLDAALAERARLLAERDNSGRPSIALTEPHAAPSAATAFADQRRLFQRRQHTQKARIAILEQKIAQLDQQRTALKAQAAARDKQKRLLEEELRNLAEPFRKGYVTRARILALETEVSRLLGEHDAFIASMARIDEEISETKLQIVASQSVFQEDASLKLRETEEKIGDLRQRLAAAIDRQSRTIIRAPTDGTVVGLQLYTVGGVVKPGETILEIIPSNDPLIIEAELDPQDIDTIRPGMTAQVRFPGLKRILPTVGGKVIVVSADRMVDELHGRAYYRLRVDVPRQEFSKLDGVHMSPGMPAEVMVVTGERTVLTYLLQPLLDASGRMFRED